MSEKVLGNEWAVAWIQACARITSDERAALNDLDRAIGDGDHGENLDRGFSAVAAKLDSAAPAQLGETFKLVATTLMSTVGGAAGPLYGTAFLRAGKAAGEADNRAGGLDATGVAELLEAGLAGLVARGKAEPGDKTMVDAWDAAATAARAAAESGSDPVAVWAEASAAAEAGARATEPMVARKGRASYLGERSAGHRDPGAQSSAMLLAAAAAAARDTP
ncbi:dihydroxyacetone kinase subunit DhaL [Pseudactinotalea sp. HY158]|uniref:dihydroxyacetone kinase subunit DhaL n=1 Tax=Pseudactinotalea sp. HY158 TaxID=2654547 RepID=UPI00129C7614|nr:dihydroxyacetone kinase subunit DhaL [Pseudactinotalea sp. HY158]QGH69921.1 dihydroxyacetone kinase subunit L [Pseudactinotalea sp. HY158]